MVSKMRMEFWSCPSKWSDNAADADNPLKRQLEDIESKLDYVMSDLLQIKETFEQTVQLTKDTFTNKAILDFWYWNSETERMSYYIE